MSHVVASSTVVQDLDALAIACAELGLELRRGQTSFRWYGRWVDDYNDQDAALRHGINPADYGKCEHAIVIPGDAKAYEIGLVKNPQGEGYKLVFDFWGPQGGKIANKVGGNSCGLLAKTYAVTVAERKARSLGKLVIKTALPNGGIQLKIRV